MSRSLSNQSGFTIVEVMIAVVVMIIGLVSTAAMQTRAMEEANEAARQSQRVQGAEYWMEDMMSRPIVSDGTVVTDDIFSDNCSGRPECADGSWFHAIGDGELDSSHESLYRVTRLEPLDDLVTIQVRTVPTYGRGGGEREDWLDKKAVVLTYIRSIRYN